MTGRTLLLACVLVAAAAGRHEVLQSRPLRTPGASISQLPRSLGGWQSMGDVTFPASVEALLRADEYVNRTYRGTGSTVGLYVGHHRTQRQGTAIHTPLNCLPGAGWWPVSFERVALDDAGPTVNRVVVQKAGARQVVYYWYQSHQRVVASEYWSKFYLVADALTTRRSDVALVRVIVPISSADGSQRAFDEGRAFASLALSAVDNALFQ
jgi:EpsI family protein